VRFDLIEQPFYFVASWLFIAHRHISSLISLF
jgi:hypothetical protein